MNYLWLGLYLNKESKEYLQSIGYKSMSAIVSQESFVNGIKKLTKIDTISGGRFPSVFNGGPLKTKEIKWEDFDGSKNILVSALGIKYFEHLYKSRQMKKMARKWAKENSEPIVFVYGVHSPYLKAAIEIKKINPKAKIVCIVPDLPEYMDFNPSPIKKLLKKIDRNSINKMLKKVDKFVLFTENMVDALNIQDKEYTVIEGSIDLTQISITESKVEKKNIILYSGAMDYGYGLEILVDGFSLIEDKSWELHLYGAGSAIKYIKDKNNPQIKYMGFCKNREELFNKQREAKILACVLPPENNAVKYCFPSKLFEYLLSGTPTISFYLPGISNEWREHIVEIEKSSPSGIKNAIEKVISMTDSESLEFGRKAKEFIINNKTNIIQAKKLLDFVNEIE